MLKRGRFLLPLLALLLAVGIVASLLRGLRPAIDLEVVASLDWPSRIEALSAGEQDFEGVRVDHVERRAAIVVRGAGGCAVADLGDLRFVRPGHSQVEELRCPGVLISTTRAPTEMRGTAKRSLGHGNGRLAVVERRGVTEIRWGELAMELRDGVLRIDGRELPLGLGRRLLVFDPEGRLRELRPL
jgi:hypothetical protein